ncbi:MAG: Maf family nucleotide pyrophosphatase [Xanthomonadales bacterium]|nr:Maf family nucleotide pyrophosphatase [Xanthomonadales bacterium]
MTTQSHKRPLILASGSPYRKLLLERLRLPFSVQVPGIEEKPLAGEGADAYAVRLALEKAQTVATRSVASVVIGSDQVASCEGRLIGKPGSLRRAVEQLESFSGKTVDFFSAFAVMCCESKLELHRVVLTKARFRTLIREEIERYVEQDRPIDCAGGFKSETAGISLLESMRSDDPTAIVGLPLISLSHALRQAGYRLP